MKTLTLLLLLMLPCAAAKNIEKRIFDGRNCNRFERQYHVVVYTELANGRLGYCGGSLISRRSVLTAAHCGGGPMTLRLGPHTSPNPLWQVIPVNQQFKRRRHDIMVVRLNHDVPTNFPTVRLPVAVNCLWPALGHRIEMAGYGGNGIVRDPKSNRFVKVGGRPPAALQCATMKMTACTEEYGKNIFCFERFPRTLTDTCDGDSGGGVEYQGFLHGVFIAGSDLLCDSPSIAKDVCPFLKWIHEVDDGPAQCCSSADLGCAGCTIM